MRSGRTRLLRSALPAVLALALAACGTIPPDPWVGHFQGKEVWVPRGHGSLWSPTVVKAMGAHGLDPLRWSDDPRDWSRPGSAAVVHRVVAGLHPGVVILMHDGGGDRSQSVEALAFLLDAVVAAGWKPVLAPHVRLSAEAAARPR